MANKRLFVNLSNMPDIQDGSGKWIQSYSRTDSGVTHCYITRSSRVWNGIEQRCNEGGTAQKRWHRYVGCTNEFLNFHEFAEWCQSQPGYLKKDCHGKFWNIDKDILIPENRQYHPEKCIFVPGYVNSMFITHNKRVSRCFDYPKGVSQKEGRNKYRATYSYDGKIFDVHGFNTPEEAHRVWQENRVKEILRVASSSEFDDRLVNALKFRASIVLEDLEAGRVTK